MKKTKPLMIDAAAIERAASFRATIFLGTGRYQSEEHPTLAAARSASARLAAEARNGRLGMVYAVSPEGRSTFVPDAYQPTPTTNGRNETMPNEITSVQISQLTAIITGGGYKRSNSKEAAEKRFISIATEAGIKNAAELVKGPFNMAEHVIREKLAGKPLTIPEVHGMRPADIALTDADHATIADASKTVAAEIIRRRSKTTAERKPAEAKPAGKRAATLEAAQRGELPDAPDFSAETHKRFRPKLAKLVEMVAAGDIAGLKAEEIKPVSSSPKAMAKYRDLAVIALEAKKAAA